MPTAAQEIWRYTPIADLDLSRYRLGPVSPDVGAVPSGSLLVDAVAERAALVVTVDGRLVQATVGDAAARQGVTVGLTSDEMDLLDPPVPDALTALHDAFVPEVVVLRVPAGVVVEGPVVVLQQLTGAGVAAFPHLVVAAGAASEVTVVDHWISGDGPAYVSPVVEVRGGDGAHVSYVSVQELGPEVWQTGQLLLSPGRDAELRAWVVALGGDYARVHAAADLAAQGGHAEMFGLYFGEDHQVHDFRSLQDHRASRSKSNLLLKGAVTDDAHGVYTGLIKVREGAKATDSFLANRNLVLGEGAHVDSVPNLEIVNENDIRSCGHASATGPVDEEHVFYLESRGVPTETAERLIIFGFFDEIVSSMPLPALQNPLRRAVRRKLEKAVARA
ncbi:MAG: SufD family Fe-S cluster assembly protein [Actinomycetota bacterium]|nr:SufD family Fe-S cluster assembly protein [Actinomycetota bacterium]